ncbi:MAG: tetratricopeptide repeat protein [Spirochaetes bacterium]|nr:tetratricopeptide repeat protein [Spirochaetota bacterium]
MAIRRGLILLILGSASIVSCSGLRMGWLLWNGNRYFAEGNYQEAQLAYLQALEMGQYREWIHYNLGNVYYALGERKAALEEWDKALGVEDSRLRFSVLFNKGVLALEEGNFKEAEKLFIQALELDSTHPAAKVNLEYASLKLSSLQAQATKPQSTPKPSKLDDEGERLLHYIRQRESNRWIASDKLVVEESAEDW